MQQEVRYGSTINTKIIMLKNIYRVIKFYGKKIGYHNLWLIVRLCFWSVAAIFFPSFAYPRKFTILKSYLYKKYVAEYSLSITEKKCGENKKILWFFWWQGKKNLPAICEACYKSLERNKGSAEIVFIDQHNYMNYVDVPEIIIDKVNRKIFSITHLSDVIRVMLLAKFGGIWVDATLFFVNKIPSDWFKPDFFSIKNEPSDYEYISRNQWSTFIMGGGAFFFKPLSDFMLEYAKQEDDFIEYMTIDVFMSIMFDDERFHSLLNKVPVQNSQLHLLRQFLNEAYNDQIMARLKTSNICFKLTYKMTFVENNNGHDTFYKRILQHEKN
ncbi:MAG: capsular polysaccharide synthesis protein [archaeon]|nr:capsular polysaccharide synthesis protein [archaeon]